MGQWKKARAQGPGLGQWPRVYGVVFMVKGLGFRVWLCMGQGRKARAQGTMILPRVYSLGFMVIGVGFRVWGSGFRVQCYMYISRYSVFFLYHIMPKALQMLAGIATQRIHIHTHIHICDVLIYVYTYICICTYV
jgi:hypothetical protein